MRRKTKNIAVVDFITVGLLALVILCFTASDFAFAQGPPARVADKNQLGLSSIDNDSTGETRVTVTGVLKIVHGDDFVNKRGKFFYFLKDLKTKEIFNLHFDRKPPFHARSGAIVTVRGRANGRELYLALDESGEESIKTVMSAVETVSGEQQTIVMVVNFLDTSVSCSINNIQDLMLTNPDDSSIDDFYKETSEGNVWFAGKVTGPYVIDYNSTSSCFPLAWAEAADEAAQAEGIDLSSYNRKVYVLPRENPCGWAGLASVGGNPSQAWIFLCDKIDVYGHELGHNLGMNHSATPDYEYGDVSDIMGLSGYGLRRVNAPHMEQMGWIQPDKVLIVITGGIYDIASLETSSWQTIAPKVLKISKPDTGEYYYLSYRQPMGFDGNLASLYLNGINVHCYKGDGSPNRTYLLDTLSDGESFNDATNGLKVTQISHSDYDVKVQVAFETASTPQVPMNLGDTEPPTAPTGLSSNVRGKNINLSWNAAMDNVGVSGYALWRNGVIIGNVTETSYVDNTISSGVSYTYWVNAYDEAGNTSAPSNQVDIGFKIDSEDDRKPKKK